MSVSDHGLVLCVVVVGAGAVIAVVLLALIWALDVAHPDE